MVGVLLVLHDVGLCTTWIVAESVVVDEGVDLEVATK